MSTAESTLNRQGACLRCKRTRVLYSRGNCKPCYTYWQTKIAEGRTSWEELTTKGFASDRVLQGRPAKFATVDDVKLAEDQEEVLAKAAVNLAAQMNEQLKCECGEVLSRSELWKHQKETGHIDFTKEESANEL